MAWHVERCTDQPERQVAGVVSVLFSSTARLVAPWPDRLLAWAAVPDGEHWAPPLQRALAEHDLVPRTVHPIARLRPRGAGAEWLATWTEVRHRRGPEPAGWMDHRTERTVQLVHPPGVDAAAERVEGLVWRSSSVERELVGLARADREAGVPSERWHRDVAAYVEGSYLASDDERWQSGKGGDAADWTLSRRVIADAVDRSGSLLDIGCANGLLLQSMIGWAAERGHRIEPHGLDIVPRLVELARRRLPGWRDNIACGNAATWTPPHRYDFVHTLLGYVPEAARPAYVRRLLGEFVADNGRLIVSDYGRGPGEPPVPEALREWGVHATGEAIQDRGPDRCPIHVTWVEV